MKEMTLRQIAEWCAGKVSDEYASLVISGLSTDSRKIKAGQLFIPLRGEKYDAHDFIPMAMEHGATATLTERPLDNTPAILVKDTTEAFGAIAQAYRETLNAKFIAITGSVGKTTTKEMLAGILESTYQTAKTQGNYNGQIGLPITMMNIEDNCEVAVVELGMSYFGEMSRLTRITKPDLVVITNIGTMHIEHLGSREGILKAKLEILEGLSKNGVAVFNGDEPLLWNLRGQAACKQLYFGIGNPDCDVRAENIVPQEGGICFMVSGLGQHFEVYLPVEGQHNVYNALAAITVALQLGVAPEKLQKALSLFQNTGMRQKTYEKNGFTVIEDCYNAGPESMEAALLVLNDTKAAGKKIAVLGDMLELGHRSNAEHYRIGRLAAQKADVILTYGKLSERICSGAITGGILQRNVMHFDTHAELVNALKSRAKPGDVILFKGSRGMKMENAVHLFFAEDEPSQNGGN